MNLQQHKGKLATGSVLVLLFVIIVLWPSGSPSPPIRLTYLYTTNHPLAGRVEVFEVVNRLAERVSCGGGHYKPANRRGLNSERGDYGATLVDVNGFAAQSTNVVQVWSPKRGKQYRLVLQFIPASVSTPKFYGSARVRIVSFLSRFLRPSFVTQGRFYGMIFVESEPFESTP